jgi:hypothetical protein
MPSPMREGAEPMPLIAAPPKKNPLDRIIT